MTTLDPRPWTAPSWLVGLVWGLALMLAWGRCNVNRSPPEQAQEAAP